MPVRIPTYLTDSELVENLTRCARAEREATALFIAHLAEMDARRLHLAAGFSSLFAYCLQVLRLSESATCKRIDVARAGRRYPLLLERIADGRLSLTTARLIAPHLTSGNCDEVIAAASGLGMRAVEELVARRFPKPDVPPLVRKLPPPRPLAVPTVAQVLDVLAAPAPPPVDAPAPPFADPPRPVIAPLSTDRYQIRFTASASTWKKLRIAQDLLRHSVPSGDVAEIFDRALTLLVGDLARKKCAAVKKPAPVARPAHAEGRHIPAAVRRAVWVRDQGRCSFVAKSGRRCRERGHLEFHHVEPYAVGGAATVGNIALRCRAHNVYEAELIYGPWNPSRARASTIQAAPVSLSGDDSTGRAAG
jgi:hypothetical protein